MTIDEMIERLQQIPEDLRADELTFFSLKDGSKFVPADNVTQFALHRGGINFYINPKT